jgi:hypothetical protein
MTSRQRAGSDTLVESTNGQRSTMRRGLAVPLPLLVLFGAFLVAIIYLVSASLTRRTAPEYSPSPLSRVRAANWERVGDTLTIDATDGDRWRFVSLSRGVVLPDEDSAVAEIAVQRYRVITPLGGAIADLGPVTFEQARDTASAKFVGTEPGAPPENAAIKHWYRYNLLTHLLEPNGHVFAIRDRAGTIWKLAVLSYYCPHLEAGCLTVRYAPLMPTR